ncbi:hypothetical protein [Vibrio sp. 10N.286.49.B3]|uniref:hypothetical protein n=1 Tax=Vibrio sp. 10N.286.49.B3 TaxID=1880855 RepID=UPI0010566C4B|nr:hypothetical protein [Vibrio sp. 10N.286.49.B3]
MSTLFKLQSCSMKVKVLIVLSLFSPPVLARDYHYFTGNSASGGGVGYLEGTAAIIGLFCAWKLLQGAVTFFCEGRGWRKLVSPALVIGLFLVNDVSKQSETPRFLQIFLLLAYICASIYICSKLSESNKRNR